MAKPHFTKQLFAFLRELKRNNRREWFAAEKGRYESDVRDPLLRFIADAAEPLSRISRAVLADPRRSGGSLFRIHRDTRFSKDKSPYKTHAAAQFRHRAGRDVHAPGYYIQLAPGEVFAGAGIWHPDPDTLRRIREAVVENAKLWRGITGSRSFRAACRLAGESVKRPPRGFDPAHPLVEDLKRKDFIVVARYSEAAALRPGFLARYLRFCRAAGPFNEFLARATGMDW